MAGANTYEQVAGRLLEIRIDETFRSLGDVDAMTAALSKFLDPLPIDERVIIAADWRRCVIMAAETAARVVDALTRVNPRSLRSGLLVMPNAPTSVMQMMRLVDEAKHRERRVFTSPMELAAWLSEVTTPLEQARLMTFLSRS